MYSYYTQYYLRQQGHGLADIGPLYKGPSIYQRGSGIGNFFSGLFRNLKPLISSGLEALRDQSVKTGTAILSDVGRKPFKEILKEQGKIAVQDLTQRGVNKLKRMRSQTGGRRKNIKRRKTSAGSHSDLYRFQTGKGKRRRSRRLKKKTTKSKVKKIYKRKGNKRRNRRKERIVDIFQN